ncbi:sulfatase [Maribellus sp. YY47]|uniref:sulfatase family protein n=1 Tax=Maribellus sp. YY47 TaxID=2929486 RepID=UPI00200078EE|nr:sulfatase [Maribellus sp. YY47]MCK3685757.1 sulfatase [Maribellus sp. YY47]
MTLYLVSCSADQKAELPPPNILMITSEDNSAYFLGCYGNEMATTPNLDKLASEGFMYTHAFANCPVCAPARNTILTGVYAASNGNEHMRSKYAKSEIVKTYPEYFREAGYYCTNNVKTDYNYSGDWNAIWDDRSRKATYKNRAPGQPFFAVFSNTTTHESMIHNQIPASELKHDPAKVEIAPYHPDLPAIRHDWAQYYDRNEQMDAEIGELLKELEKSGEAENTIVIYYGDHGGVLARSKRYVYETGTRVPFIIRIPEKYKKLWPARPGEAVDRIVSFVDLIPTFLSIAGVEVPEYLQGDAFLGDQKTEDPEYAYMTRQRMDECYDMVRAVRDQKYRYIRNFMPFRISMQHIDYLFKAPSAQAWEDAFKAGETNEVQSRFFLEKPLEELYDTENDPWEINNLANEPAYADVLNRMRKELTRWMREVKDVGLIPEPEYAEFAGDGALYDYMRSDACPFEQLLEAAQLATTAGDDFLAAYLENLKSDNSAIRYWGVLGLLIHRDEVEPYLEAIRVATQDKSGAVATLAAETLYRSGDKETALSTYERIMADTVSYTSVDRTFALNSVSAMEASSPKLQQLVQARYQSNTTGATAGESGYDTRACRTLLTKWGMLDVPAE